MQGGLLAGVLLLPDLALLLVLLRTAFTGMLLRFSFFLHNDFSLLLMLFWLFSLAMTSFSYTLSCLVKKPQAAMYIGFSVFIVGWMFQVGGHVVCGQRQAGHVRAAVTTNCSCHAGNTVVLFNGESCASQVERTWLLLSAPARQQTIQFLVRLPYTPSTYYSTSNKWGRVFFWVFALYPWNPLTKGILDLNEATLAPTDPGGWAGTQHAHTQLTPGCRLDQQTGAACHTAVRTQQAPLSLSATRPACAQPSKCLLFPLSRLHRPPLVSAVQLLQVPA